MALELMPIPAGLLNQRVKLQRQDDTKDDSGQVRENWLDVAVLWARVEPIGGREQFGDQQVVATGDVRFTIRRRDDVNPLFRVVHRDRVHDVISAAPEGRDLTVVVGRARAEER